MSTGALNSRAINTATLDDGETPIVPFTATNLCLGEFNALVVNGLPVNSCQFFSTLGVSNVLSLAQIIGPNIIGEVVRFSQDVGLHIAISGSVVLYTQEVQTSIAAYNAIKFAQVVDGPGSFLRTYGWDADIVINNTVIPHNRIVDKVIITKESNQNTLCKFKVKVVQPQAFLDYIDGGTVTINYLTPTGSNRIFTGIVDLPEIDLINKTIAVNCSDRREELIKNKILPLLPTIGRYSLEVQGLITSVGQEMEYRLQTVPMDVDFDSHNIPNLNSWYVKTIPDFTFGDGDVYYREPKITWQSRGGVVNNISVEVKYSYTRLYHYQRNFSWETPLDVLHLGFNSGVLQSDDTYSSGPYWRYDNGPVSHATVNMVQSAIDRAGWKQNDTLTYTDDYADFGLFGPSVVSIGGSSFNLLNDSIGNSSTLDTNGNEVTITYAIPPVGTDQIRILSADWSGSTRFAQTIEEVYTLNIKSTQSINQFGSLTAFNNYTTQNEFDSGTWENYNRFTAAPSNAVISNDSFWFNEDTDPGVLNNAILTAIDKAKTQILASHRDTKVTLQVPLMPTLELSHTLQISTTPLECKGKTTKLIHTIDFIDRKGQTTDIELSLFQSRGTAVTTATTVPSRPSDSVSIPSQAVVLGNHYGQDVDTTSGSSTWNGYIGNTTPQLTAEQLATIPLSDGSNWIKVPNKTTFREEFVVDTPPVPDNLRKLRTLNVSSIYEIAIPDDELDIIF